MSAYIDKNSPILYARKVIKGADLALLELMFDQNVSHDLRDIEKLRNYKAYYKRYYIYKSILYPLEIFLTAILFGLTSKTLHKRVLYYKKTKAYYTQLKNLEWS